MTSQVNNLKQGLIGAWCPAVSGWGGYLLPDVSGNGNHGTLTNMDPGTDWEIHNGFYNINTAGSGYVPLAKTIDIPTECTFVSWCYWNGGTILFGGQTARYFPYVGATGYIRDSGLTSFTAGVTVSAWNHIVITQIAGVATWYTNAIERGTGTARYPTITTIGAYGDLSAYFNSRIAEIRLYNKVLDKNAITQLYLGGPGYGLRQERRRRYFVAATPSFKPYWARRQSHIIGGGVS